MIGEKSEEISRHYHTAFIKRFYLELIAPPVTTQYTARASRRGVRASQRDTWASNYPESEIQRPTPTCRVRGATLPRMTAPSHTPIAEPTCDAAKPNRGGAISYNCVQPHIEPLQTRVGEVQRKYAPSHSGIAVVQTGIAPVQLQINGCKPALHRRTAMLHYRAPVLQRCIFILHWCKIILHRSIFAVKRFDTEDCSLSIQLLTGIPPLAACKPGIA